MRKGPSLRPLAETLPGSGGGRRAEARLQGALPLLLGPAMAARTRVVALRQGKLILGCWEPTLLSSLRQSAQDAWPELRERILRTTRLRLAGVQVEPCDPPQALAPPRPVEVADPFAEVLRRYRRLAKVPFTSPQD